jgi:hypothetical protein
LVEQLGYASPFHVCPYGTIIEPDRSTDIKSDQDPQADNDALQHGSD